MAPWEDCVVSQQGGFADFTVIVVVRVAFEYTRNMSTDDWLSNQEFERGEELA
jgi:hypothetical protein